MACSHKNCSGCGSCCNSGYARVQSEENACNGCRCCKSNCGAYGILQSVAGPYRRPDPFFPYYTGPCGPCACCKGCCKGCCNSACPRISSASFAAAAPVNLNAGECVPFGRTMDASCEFTAAPEGVRIHEAGSYMVIYTVNVPANETVSSRFLLTLNGDRIPASEMDVSAIADGSTASYTMHAMIYAPAESLLKLVTLGPVSICSASASNVFILSISKN